MLEQPIKLFAQASPQPAAPPTAEQLTALQGHVQLLRLRGWTADADEFAAQYGLPREEKDARRGPDRAVGVFGDAVITTQHFRELSPNEARNAIKDGVRLVDIEIFSQCNRRCHYCSNTTIDRLSSNQFMADAVFEQIVSDLGSIDWEGQFRFIGLNEPTMHRESLVARARQARARIPKALLVVFSNGDYLTRDYLEELYDAGVRALQISVHLQRFMPFDDQKVLKRIEMLVKRLRVEWRIDRHIPGREVYGTLLFRDMLIQIFQLDYEHVGHDRGGILEGIGRQDYVRTAACVVPVKMIVVSYNGKVLPCCHFVGDAEQHQGLVVGTLGEGRSLFDIYASPEALEWRRSLFTIGPKGAECRKCTDYADDASMQSPEVIAAVANPLATRQVRVFGGDRPDQPVEATFRVGRG
jgi:radical SAM protein with 4Fe4S-binding SPASM domain